MATIASSGSFRSIGSVRRQRRYWSVRIAGSAGYDAAVQQYTIAGAGINMLEQER